MELSHLTGTDTPSRPHRVSIVIPCYNHAHFLPDAIGSALAQSWPHCEVIVIDDGSTDETSDVARAHPGVTLFRQANRGLAAARNTGLRIGQGDVIIFLDADDRLAPDAARIALAAFTANPSAAMAFGRCRLMDAAGTPGRTPAFTIRSCHYEELLRDNAIWTPAVAAFRRHVFDAVGAFDETNSPAADYDLYLRISRSFPVVSHDATVADYRQHGENMSRDPILMLDATLRVLRAQQPHVAGHPTREAALRDAMRNWRALYGERLVDRFRTALRERRFYAAGRDAIQLLRWYPAGVRQHLRKKLALIVRPQAPGSRDELQASDATPRASDPGTHAGTGKQAAGSTSEAPEATPAPDAPSRGSLLSSTL